MKKYYDILELHESATIEEIKSAYKKISKKYHPDLHHGNVLEELASEKFRQIKEAYDILTKKSNSQSKSSNTRGNNKNSFNLYGFNLTFSDKSLNYNLFRSNLNLNIENYIEMYKINYLSYKSLDNFVKNDMSYTINIIKGFIDLTIKRAVAIGYDIYSGESFYKRYGSQILYNYEMAYTELNSALELIEYNKSVQDYQRKFQHDLKFQKSVFTHVGNLAKKASIANEAYANKKSYYENEETLKGLLYIIEEALLDVIDIVCNIVGIQGQEVFEKEFSYAIYENIDLYDPMLKKEKICQALNSYPYLSELYSYALNSYGDSNGELERMASIFGISLKYLKEKIKERIYNECEERKVGNFDIAKEKIKSSAEFYGVSYDDLLERMQEEIELQEFNKLYGKKLSEVNEIANISEETLTNYIEAVNKIEMIDLPEELKAETLSKLRTKIDFLEKDYKETVETSLFTSLVTSVVSIFIGFLLFKYASRFEPGFFRTIFKWFIYLVAFCFLGAPVGMILDKKEKSNELKNLNK